MEKVLFALDFEDGDDWPPVASEGVWCERVGAEYRLLNAPFFIKDLAVGDVFSVILFIIYITYKYIKSKVNNS